MPETVGILVGGGPAPLKVMQREFGFTKGRLVETVMEQLKMFDGLMGRAVFSDGDRVMREHVNHRHFSRCWPDTVM